MKNNQRIVRVPLPVELIRQMDELILSGTGEFGCRAEFIHEAVEALVLENTFEAADPISDLVGDNDRELIKEIDIRLPSVDFGYVLENGVAKVEDDLIFGLHNRDYPSLWAAVEIARLTHDGPMEGDQLFAEVTNRAWNFAKALSATMPEKARRATALFPTNTKKPQTASAGFKSYGIGKFSRNGNGIIAHGPLFCWGVCQVELVDNQMHVGITSAGYDLLAAVAGISAEQPHNREAAERFIAYLKVNAPADWSGMSVVLAAASGTENREQLCSRFARLWPDIGQARAPNYASGYVARCREWGLLEPKLQKGSYTLTDFGRKLLVDNSKGNTS